MLLPRIPIIKILIVAALCFMGLRSAFSAEVPPPAGENAVPCAILQRFDGEVQVLDATRNQLLKTTLKAGVPCGSWISIREGWAELRHREGHVVKMGPETFMEIYDPRQNPASKSPDQYLLIRGRLWVSSPKGVPNAKVQTANAEVTLTGATALVAYHPDEEETQLMTTDGAASISNRYSPDSSVTTNAGEMSTLNLKLLRVVPTAAAAVNLASLHAVMSGMPIEPKERELALAAAQKRIERKFASKLEVSAKGDRKIASTSPGKIKVSDHRYERHIPAIEGEADARSEWLNRLTGGESSGKAMLHPRGLASVGHKKKKNIKVEVHDPDLEMDRKKFKEEENEKIQLMNELKKIQAE